MVIGLGACGGGSSSPAAVTIDGLTPAFAEVFCAQMSRCCSPDDFPNAEAAAVFAGRECASAVEVRVHLEDQFNLARLQQSVRGGLAVLDGALARACLDSLGRLSCPNWSAATAGQQAALPDACRQMIQGTRPVGGACMGNFEHECASGSCGGGPAMTCVPAPTEGQACPSRCEDVFDCSARCASGLRCGADDVCARNPAPSLNTTCDGT
jgi:hypothetical protein